MVMGIFPPILNFMIIPIIVINFILYYFILKGVLSYYMSHIYEYNQGQHGERRFEDRDSLIETYNLVPAYGNFDDVEPGVVIAWEKTNDQLMDRLNKKYGLDEKIKFLETQDDSLSYHHTRLYDFHEYHTFGIYVDKSPVHNLIIGTTRSGKGETFVLPTLDLYSRAYKSILGNKKQELDIQRIFKKYIDINKVYISSLVSRKVDLEQEVKSLENRIKSEIKSLVLEFDITAHKDYIVLEGLKRQLETQHFELKQILNFNESPNVVINEKQILSNEIDYVQLLNLYIENPEDYIKIIEDVIRKEIIGVNNQTVRFDKFYDENGKYFIEYTYELITDNSKQPSMIINDPKGELCEMMYTKLRSRGYEVKILNVADPTLSNAYNPLQAPLNYFLEGDEDKAQTLVGTLANQIFPTVGGADDVWQKAAQSLFSAVSLALLEDNAFSNPEKISMYNVYKFMQELGGKEVEQGVTELDLYFETKEPIDKSRTMYGTIQLSKGNTLSSILMNTATSLSVFIGDKVARMMSDNEIDINNIGFGDKPVAVFMIVPDYDSSLHSIPSLFISQVYFTLSERLSRTNSKHLPRAVVFMLDEFGNMPPIHDMGSMITVGAGRWMFFNLIVQDYEQIDVKYDDMAETIKSNCANHIYIMSNGDETLKTFSEKLGNKTVTEYAPSGDLFEKKSFTPKFEEKPLLSPDKLKELKFEESVLIRPLQRQNKKYEDIDSVPIANMGDDRLVARFKYMTDLPDDKTVKDIFQDNKIIVPHIEINLAQNIYKPNVSLLKITKDINMLMNEIEQSVEGITESTKLKGLLKERNNLSKLEKLMYLNYKRASDTSNRYDTNTKNLLKKFNEKYGLRGIMNNDNFVDLVPNYKKKIESEMSKRNKLREGKQVESKKLITGDYPEHIKETVKEMDKKLHFTKDVRKVIIAK